MAERKNVSLEDLDFAIMWLNCNEGDEQGESEACKRVADMLNKLYNTRASKKKAR